MNRFHKILTLTAACFLLAGSLIAQKLEDGKRFQYYERYQSARQVFEQLLAADPSQVEAAYWLGQAMLGQEKMDEAKALYQKHLLSSNNHPLLLAGMGQIELMEGKAADARSHFETAVSLSQGKNLAVLNAVGMANASPDVPNGDPNFAVIQLTAASGLKGMKDPDVFVNLGDAYRKLSDGGNALKAYNKAISLEPNYARAYFRIGKMYQTQGQAQEDLYMQFYNDAIAKDPTYGPVYKNLWELYYNTNVSKSAEYLEKFLANKDEEPKNCYYRASMKYAQGLFAEAVSAADVCLKDPAASANLFGLKAYAYNKLGDSLQAKQAFEQYFAKQEKDKIGGGDYSAYGLLLLKFPGNEKLAADLVEKAVAVETEEANKVNYMKAMAQAFEKAKLFGEAAEWYARVVNTKKAPTKTDMYYAGFNYFRSGKYQSSIEIFNRYAEKFPEDAFSHYMIGKANWAVDSTMEQGLANPHFEKAIQLGEVDKAKYKNQLIPSYKYFIAYYVNVAKDKDVALSFCDKVLEVDPNDKEATSNKTLIANMNLSAPAKPGAGQQPSKPMNAAGGKQEAATQGGTGKQGAPLSPGSKR